MIHAPSVPEITSLRGRSESAFRLVDVPNPAPVPAAQPGRAAPTPGSGASTAAGSAKARVRPTGAARALIAQGSIEPEAIESALARTRRARRMYRALRVRYPDAHCELHFETPFQLLVATVLSAQTTDVRVNQVTPRLFADYPTALALASADRADLESIIGPTGFFRTKSQSLLRISAELVQQYDGQVPARLKDLVKLPGVGRKTANVVLGNAFDVPGITVDTHVGRLARRFGWTGQDDPVRVETDLEGLIARRDWTMLSHVMIFHGRRTCHARKPACAACVVATDCPSYGIGETDPARAARLVKGPTQASPETGGSALSTVVSS